MMLIGLSGPAGVGKDTIADYLVETHGFTKFSFSDALYREVSEAFRVPIEELQRRETKEVPHPRLTAEDCRDSKFGYLMVTATDYDDEFEGWRHEFSPRWVLQRWGTDYRRAQDPDYWTKKTALWVQAWLDVTEDDGEYHGGLVNTSVRFPNERAFIEQLNGLVWHVRRRDTGAVASEQDYASERGLDILPQDRVIYNNGTTAQLRTAASLMLSSPEGTRLELGVPDYVTCKKCGWIHKAYSRAWAEQEVAAANEAFDKMTPEQREMFGTGHVSADHYIGCMACGSEEFRPTKMEDWPGYASGEQHAITINPVIYEENA
jgi:hypothetical protein